MIRNHRLFFVLGPLPNFYRKMLTVVHFALTILVSVSSDSYKKKSSILAAPGAGGCGGTVDPGFLIALHTPVPTKKRSPDIDIPIFPGERTFQLSKISLLPRTCQSGGEKAETNTFPLISIRPSPLPSFRRFPNLSLK